MIYTVQCCHQTIQLEISELETLHYISQFLYEYYHIQDISQYHWYVYYEMPQLLEVKLLRSLNEDFSLKENGVQSYDVLIALRENEVFQFFRRTTSPWHPPRQHNPIDPNLTVFQLKRAIQLQIPYFAEVLVLDLQRGNTPLVDNCTLVSYDLQPGETILMIPRMHSPNHWQTRISSPSIISVFPTSPYSPVSLEREIPQIPESSRSLVPLIGSPPYTPKKLFEDFQQIEFMMDTFDSYIQKIQREDEEKELMVQLRGNFTRITKDPKEFNEIRLLVKVTSSMKQIKSMFMEKYPLCYSFYLTFLHGMTRLDDSVCIIEVAGSDSSTVTLTVRLTETLSSRIEHITYVPTIPSPTGHLPHSNKEIQETTIFPAVEGTFKMKESVELIPHECQLFIQFQRNNNDYPLHFHADNQVSPFREVFNINNISIRIESMIGHVKVPFIESVEGYRFNLQLVLPEAHFYRIVISYQDHDHTRQLIFPFYAVNVLQSCLSSSSSSPSEARALQTSFVASSIASPSRCALQDVSNEIFLYNPYDQMIQPTTIPVNEVKRIILHGSFPAIYLSDEIIIQPSSLPNKKEVTIDLPLIFLNASQCVVKDIKKKLSILMRKKHVEGIQLFLQGKELFDETSLKVICGTQDMIIAVNYQIVLEDVIAECSYNTSAIAAMLAQQGKGESGKHEIVLNMATNHFVAMHLALLPLLILPTTMTVFTIKLSHLVQDITEWKEIAVSLGNCRDNQYHLINLSYQEEVAKESLRSIVIEIMQPLEGNSFYELKLNYFHKLQKKEKSSSILFRTDKSEYSTSPNTPSRLFMSNILQSSSSSSGEVTTPKKSKQPKKRGMEKTKKEVQSPTSRRKRRVTDKYHEFVSFSSELDDENNRHGEFGDEDDDYQP